MNGRERTDVDRSRSEAWPLCEVAPGITGGYLAPSETFRERDLRIVRRVLSAVVDDVRWRADFERGQG